MFFAGFVGSDRNEGNEKIKGLMKTNGEQENIVWKAVLLMKNYFPICDRSEYKYICIIY